MLENLSLALLVDRWTLILNNPKFSVVVVCFSGLPCLMAGGSPGGRHCSGAVTGPTGRMVSTVNGAKYIHTVHVLGLKLQRASVLTLVRSAFAWVGCCYLLVPSRCRKTVAVIVKPVTPWAAIFHVHGTGSLSKSLPLSICLSFPCTANHFAWWKLESTERDTRSRYSTCTACGAESPGARLGATEKGVREVSRHARV